MRGKAGGPPFGPARIRDWLLLVVSLLLAAVGGWEIVSGRDWRTGVITVVMFGGAFALSAGRIFVRLRQSRRTDVEAVAIAGSRDIPMDRRRMLARLVGVGLFGAVCAVLGETMPLLLRLTCAGLTVFAAGMILALLLDLIPNPMLRFEPEGLVIQRGAKRRYRVTWDNIADMAVGEGARIPIILLRFHDARDITLGPAAVRALVEREIGQTRGLYGADALISPRLFGLDAQLLVAALQRYIEYPAARAELGEWKTLSPA